MIDVSDPTAPVERAYVWDLWFVSGVEMVGDVAYLADHAHGLRAVDVSDPAFPLELGALGRRHRAWDVEVAGSLVYGVGRESGLQIVDFGPEYVRTLAVDLDIKPGSDPNVVNPSARGLLPVAILGSDRFDATSVEPTTLSFGPGGAAPVHAKGGHAEDVDGDGYVDWISHYRIEDVGIPAGETTLCARGFTSSARPLEGCDTVRTRSQ